MQIIRFHDSDFQVRLAQLCQRSAFPAELERNVAAMLDEVRRDGDAAVSRFARQYDKVELAPAEFRVSEAEVAAAEAQVDAPTRAALELAHANVAAFAREGAPHDWSFAPRPGVTLGERFAPLDRVAAYVPGGSAPLVSTILHTLTLAQVAGVREIVFTTPVGPSKQVNPAMLYAARLAGATEIYRLGGVYAIAALAYGTASIRPVEKIVGPGNAYVTAAKRLVYGHVALDLVAGPSEILVLADEMANPRYLAADILSQAEHGSGHEQAVLVCTCPGVLGETRRQLELQAAALPKAEAVSRVLERGVFLILVENLEQGIAIANRFAPEHMEILTKEPEAVLPHITAAGALFLGPYTPEPVGDFVAGPSHVLPTGGSARFFSGLTVQHFYRRMSVVKYDHAALRREGEAIRTFGRIEGLAAHARTIDVRLE